MSPRVTEMPVAKATAKLFPAAEALALGQLCLRLGISRSDIIALTQIRQVLGK